MLRLSSLPGNEGAYGTKEGLYNGDKPGLDMDKDRHLERKILWLYLAENGEKSTSELAEELGYEFDELDSVLFSMSADRQTYQSQFGVYRGKWTASDKTDIRTWLWALTDWPWSRVRKIKPAYVHKILWHLAHKHKDELGGLLRAWEADMRGEEDVS